MKIVEHNMSSSRPAKILKGYSGTLYNTDIKEVVKEDGEIMYDFTSYFFDNAVSSNLFIFCSTFIYISFILTLRCVIFSFWIIRDKCFLAKITYF